LLIVFVVLLLLHLVLLKIGVVVVVVGLRLLETNKTLKLLLLNHIIVQMANLYSKIFHRSLTKKWFPTTSWPVVPLCHGVQVRSVEL
jgi:hypothetical protein